MGKIKAARPPADDIRLFKPILLAAYGKACPDVSNVQSEIRPLQGQEFVVMRCGEFRPSGPSRAVRIVYTGETVPRLVGTEDHNLQSLAAMLNLRIRDTVRNDAGGDHTRTIVSQHPAAGTVVPANTLVTVVVAG